MALYLAGQAFMALYLAAEVCMATRRIMFSEMNK
jgi:hypothetical protein